MHFDVLTHDGNPTGLTVELPYPPPLGSTVTYRGGEDAVPATIGTYTVAENDEYWMCGYVVIEDSLGRQFPVDAKYLTATVRQDPPGYQPPQSQPSQVQPPQGEKG